MEFYFKSKFYENKILLQKSNSNYRNYMIKVMSNQFYKQKNDHHEIFTYNNLNSWRNFLKQIQSFT